MEEPTEDFTVIECAYRREHGGPYYDYFIRIDGQWLAAGAESYDDTWADVTGGYEAVRVVATPSPPAPP